MTEPSISSSSSTACYLLFSDGTLFTGNLLGKEGFNVGEVIFNTSMSGYQEIITDPSYAKQLICFTASHIGNVGVNEFDTESSAIFSSGVIVRDYCADYSNFRAQKSLHQWLKENEIIGIANVDTRQITRIIREKGVMSAVIYSKGFEDEAKKALDEFGGLGGLDLAKQVSTQKIYSFAEGLFNLSALEHSPASKAHYKVAVVDFGVKKQILRILTSLGCELTIYPAQSDFELLQSGQFDGVFLSNGPGDPYPCGYAIELIQKLLAEKKPIFGICLGHQLLALALGAQTEKMKTGHHGANHPVQCLETQRVFITSQNHGFCVSESIPSEVCVTHRSLFDRTIQGIKHKHLPAYGFQGHPEASPGPHDIRGVFLPFIEMMQKNKT